MSINDGPSSTSSSSQREDEDTALPYWQVNVPAAQRTATCPDFLADVNDKSKRILSTPDGGYKRLSWADVKSVVAENRLDAFQRVPSDLRRYLQYVFEIKRRHGSVMEFVLRERIRWGKGEMKPRGRRPFEDASDIRILYNDWPYGIDEGIVHLVVWTKFDLAEDPSTGDLTDEARRQIDDYVRTVFGSGGEDVAWFKNWKSLKSVEAVEHFHVLLNRPDLQFVADLTGNDIPMAEKLKHSEVALIE
ncbi:hypothetical protein ANO11243_002940 [Dothideomycetidae sp. 11243]|nr:hypothetical protein ANO11243_002940 [fungal sp. No.11243]